jgi:hypothetical protein
MRHFDVFDEMVKNWGKPSSGRRGLG